MGRYAKGLIPVHIHRDAFVNRAREEGLTLSEVAARCGRSSKSLNDLLSGRVQVTPLMEQRLMAALRIAPSEKAQFFFRNGFPKGSLNPNGEPVLIPEQGRENG